jgi:hypothetical protein
MRIFIRHLCLTYSLCPFIRQIDRAPHLPVPPLQPFKLLRCHDDKPWHAMFCDGDRLAQGFCGISSKRLPKLACRRLIFHGNFSNLANRAKIRVLDNIDLLVCW